VYFCHEVSDVLTLNLLSDKKLVTLEGDKTLPRNRRYSENILSTYNWIFQDFKHDNKVYKVELLERLLGLT
jgi:hypothetical protein